MISRFADKHHTAFLFLLGLWLDKHEEFAFIDFVAQQEQSTMRTHYLGLAKFAKLAPVMRAAFGLNSSLMKFALTAANTGLCDLAHAVIIRRARETGQLPFRAGVRIPNGSGAGGSAGFAGAPDGRIFMPQDEVRRTNLCANAPFFTLFEAAPAFGFVRAPSRCCKFFKNLARLISQAE